MNAHEHLPVDDLAAYAAGDLDAPAALAVEAHLVLCAECRTDVAAVNATTAALAAVERPVMPADVAARIDAALHATPTGPVADVLPMQSKRRRPSLAGLAAVAAGIALVAAIGVPFLNGSSPNSDTTAARENGGTRRITSNLDYTHATLATTLDQALSGVAAKDAGAPNLTSGGGFGGTSATPVPMAPAPGTVPSASGSPTFTTRQDAVEVAALAPLINDGARLGACVDALAAGLPAAARQPLVLDFARFAGNPALLVAFPTVSQGEVKNDKIDVFVVGPRCGVTAGDDDVLDFARINRPNGL